MGDDALMTDEFSTIDVRSLRPDEYRAGNNLFRAAMHTGPVTDEGWALRGESFEDGRFLGAFADGTLVGSSWSYSGSLLVPGGTELPMAMVTGVGVRADRTRRGVVTALMRHQLTTITEPVASLRASEAPIYGRFGYGVATRGRTVKIDRRRARLRPEVPGTSGSVRLIPLSDAWDLLPALYASLRDRRPGWTIRPDSYWSAMRYWISDSKEPTQVAVHSGPDGDDGFAVYNHKWGSGHGGRAALSVGDLFGDSPEVWAALWRFLLGVDLVDDIKADLRPLDEPLEELFTDRRVVETEQNEDETWLRLVDVPAALAARAFGELSPGAGSVVVEVRDAFLPANSGRYRLGDGPARRVEEPAELTMDQDVLAGLYLGDSAPSALAATGRIAVAKSDALAVADRLFAVLGSPWCGTYF